MSENMFHTEHVNPSVRNYFFKLSRRLRCHPLLQVTLPSHVIRDDAQNDSEFFISYRFQNLYGRRRVSAIQFEDRFYHRNNTFNGCCVLGKALRHFVNEALSLSCILTSCACKSGTP